MTDAATTLGELAKVWGRVKELPEADREVTYAVLKDVKARMQQDAQNEGTAA